MNPIYMVIGCPGSGKSWVCEQLESKFHYVHHDLYIGMAGDSYLKEIFKAAKTSHKPILIESPFSISQIKDPLEADGYDVIPVFIQERESILKDRYLKREKRPIPQGHLTRQKTYYERYMDHFKKKKTTFCGTSEECLKWLGTKA